MRIVSLLPAATEIVCGLGLREALVGRSHECDFPEDVAALPALTRARVDSSLASGALDDAVKSLLHDGRPLYELDEERLHALSPDVVVTQAACEVCAISYEQVARVARRVATGARVVSLQPARLEDVLRDVLTVAEACGVADRGERLRGDLRRRLARLKDAMPSRRPRVAVVEWLEPPMLAAHWVPELLEAAGAEAVGTTAGTMSPYVSWDALAALRPDALVVGPCGFDLARTVRESAPYKARLRAIAPRVLLMDGNAYWNRPGPRLVEAAEALARWLADGTVPAGACE